MPTTFFYLALVLGIGICALQSIRAHLLISSVLWLAGVSAITAILLYTLGAPEVAAIELSVGAGLVTVLFVFAISIAGEIRRDLPTLVPRPLVVGMGVLVFGLLVWRVWPVGVAVVPDAAGAGLTTTVWTDRAVDMWVLVILILAGVLGILNLLVEEKSPSVAETGRTTVSQPADLPLTAALPVAARLRIKEAAPAQVSTQPNGDPAAPEPQPDPETERAEKSSHPPDTRAEVNR